MTSPSKPQEGKYQALPIPLDFEDKLLVPTKVEDQIVLLTASTPKKFIQSRKGRGGQTLDYIATPYVIARLNATFFFNWDVQVIWHEVNWRERQVAVRISLRVKFIDGREVVKEAYGGSDIKFNKVGELIDFADDLKAAESDALKKAASMLGVGWDVYAGYSEESRQQPDPKKEAKDKESPYVAKLHNAREKFGAETFDPLLLVIGFKSIDAIPINKLERVYEEVRKAWKSRKKVEKPQGAKSTKDKDNEKNKA
jgi:hypothetical protein